MNATGWKNQNNKNGPPRPTDQDQPKINWWVGGWWRDGQMDSWMAGCWMLGAGCWMLDAGRVDGGWMTDDG
jgi:hypothetical protein